MSHRSGDVLGRYQLLCPIAAGGMATVWAARVRGAGTFQKPVALKLMLSHLARDERFVKMFMDEAMLAANIQSPHVVGTYDLGHDEDTLYMSMELVLGMTLRDLLLQLAEASKPMPLEVGAAVAVAVARGLSDAHEAKGPTGDALGIIHRDVSPHNVLLGLDGRSRLSDFGIARAVQRQSKTETGEVKGKLSYFAPEQLKGEELDQRVDVFALGIVIWETLAGRRLFDAENPLQLAFQIANQPIPRLDTVRPEIPASFADAVDRALVRERSERWQTARAFADALSKADVTTASETECAAFFRSHAGTKVEALEKRVRELMALPTDAAVENFRTGETGKVALVHPAKAKPPMPGLPRESLPTAPPPVPAAPARPNYGRIAAVLVVAVVLLAGTAWGAFAAFGASAEPTDVPIAAPTPPPSAAETTTTVAPPTAPPASELPAAPPTEDPIATPTAVDPARTPSTHRTGRSTSTSVPAPPVPPPSSTAPAVAERPPREAPRTAEPTPPPATTTETPRRSIVADQDEFCRAMGTCP